MLHQMSQVAVALLVAVFISTTLTSAGNIRPVLGRDEITECDTILRVSHVCYQCSKVHEEEFNTVYKSCCTGVPAMRDYCNFIYTEPPKRGGLWM